MKIRVNTFSLICMCIGVSIILLICVLSEGKCYKELNKIEPKTIYMDQKMNECIEAGGEYSVLNYAWEGAPSDDYRATCEIPEKKLWRINL